MLKGHCRSLPPPRARFFYIYLFLLLNALRILNEFTNFILKIVSTNCNPSLLYGLEACPVTKRQLKSLSYPFNSVFMKLFKTFNADIIRQVQYFSGYLPLSYVIDLRRLTFFHDLYYFDKSPAATLFFSMDMDEMMSLRNSYAIPEGASRGSLRGYILAKFKTECEDSNS